MKLEIPIKVDLKGIDKLIEELKALQTYKLSEGDDMILVSLDDVVEVFANHIVAINDNAGSVKVTNCNDKEMIYREDAIDALRKEVEMTHDDNDEQIYYIDADNAISVIEHLPSAQPEQRCVNCGRTVNNGGWYEDGRTRCPIEEHYALPKDGYCHLWEKKKVWEDDYVKRPEEGESDE